jgi:exonuclease VII large subunit
MTKNSALSFSQTLQDKAKKDSETIQRLQQEQLQKLAESLSSTLKSELATTQQDMRKAAESLQESLRQQHQHMQSLQQEQAESLQERQEQLAQQLDKSVKASQRALRWSWLRAAVPSLSVLAIILASSWGLMQYYTSQVIKLHRTTQSMERNIEELTQKGGTVRLNTCGDKGRLCVKLNSKSEEYKDGSGGVWRILDGH